SFLSQFISCFLYLFFILRQYSFFLLFPYTTLFRSIFDEATSALDLESEQNIQKAMEKLASERTTFIVAHRLATITHADRIVVIEDRKSTRLNSSHVSISYAVFCLKKKIIYITLEKN